MTRNRHTRDTAVASQLGRVINKADQSSSPPPTPAVQPQALRTGLGSCCSCSKTALGVRLPGTRRENTAETPHRHIADERAAGGQLKNEGAEAGSGGNSQETTRLGYQGEVHRRH